jgi:drug/metabolite transporter (DMT)-like permease
MIQPAGRSLSPLLLACVAATWFIWGSTYLAIRFAIGGLPPFFMMGTRFTVAGAMLLAYTLVRGAPLPTALQWRNAVIVGTLMLVFGMGFTAQAELTVGSGLVVAFIAVTPLLVVLFTLLFGIRPGRGEVAGIVIGLGGVLMLTQGAGFRASPAGLGWLVLATLGWSSGSVLSQHRLPLATGATGFASEMLCGGVALILMSAATGEQVAWPVPSGAWLAWGYLVIFGSLVAFNAYMLLLARASSGVATSYSYVNPIIALFLGIAFAGETVTSWEWLSAGVVLVGVVLVLFSRR